MARRSLEAFGCIVVAPSLDEAMAFANRYAPEHLELIVSNPQARLDQATDSLHGAERSVDQAQSAYDEALQVSTKQYGADSLQAAEVLNGQAELYKTLNDYGRAEPLLLQALQCAAMEFEAGVAERGGQHERHRIEAAHPQIQLPRGQGPGREQPGEPRATRSSSIPLWSFVLRPCTYPRREEW